MNLDSFVKGMIVGAGLFVFVLMLVDLFFGG